MIKLKNCELQNVVGGCIFIDGGYIVFRTKSDFARYFNLDVSGLRDLQNEFNMSDGNRIHCYSYVPLRVLNNICYQKQKREYLRSMIASV